MVEIIARTLPFPRTNMHVAERSCSDPDFCVACNHVHRHDHSAMVKFCRECSALMPGRARYCPQCARRWLPVGAHHLAEAADLLQPPVNCAWCQTQMICAKRFCPRCGLRLPLRAPASARWSTAR